MSSEPVWVVKKVVAEDNYMLRLLFADGSKKLFDFRPYLDRVPYLNLKDRNEFFKVRVAGDSVIWDNGIDIAPEELYEKSVGA